MSPPVFAKRPNYLWHDDTATRIILAGVFLFIVSNILLLIILGNDLYNSANDIDVNAGVSILISSLLSLLAFGGSVWALGVRKHPLKWHAVGFRRTSWTWFMLSLALGVFFVPVNIGVSSFIQSLVVEERVAFIVNEPEFDTVPLMEFTLTFIGVAIIVPIAEEIFFRGMLFKWMRTRTNLMLALIVTSTAFGAVHLSSISLLSLSVAGAFCAVMYEYSGSLWNAIAVHAGNNGTVVILTYFVFKSSVF